MMTKMILITCKKKSTQSLKSPVSKLLSLSLYSSSTTSSLVNSSSSRSVRVSVWWDIEKSCFPSGINVFKIAHYITNAVRFNGIKGPIHISAFGDLLSLSRPHQLALSTTAINLIHVPNGGKNSADRSLLVDLMHWVSQNPPPAHIFLISSDPEFAGILHKLRMNNYNILLACNDGVHTPGVLSSAASIMWHWNELAKGENFSGRHFNQPPDGPFNSWYGHYRGPLEDPFDVPKQQNSPKTTSDKSNTEVISENPQIVPKAILKEIHQVIDSCPDGISSGEFRRLLARNKVVTDKNLYGYKRFSQFVKSMPDIIKVLPGADGRLYLHPVVSVDNSASSKIEDENRDIQIREKAKDGNQTISRMVDFEPRLPDSSLKEEKVKPNVEESHEKKEKSAIDSVAAIEKQDSKDEIGRFRRWWRKWFMGSGEMEKTIVDISDKTYTVSVSQENSLSKEGRMGATNQHEIKGLENVSVESSRYGESEVGPGFVTKVLSWFKPQKNEVHVNTTTEQSTEEPRSSEDLKHEDTPALVKLEEAPQSLKHDLFSNETFWSAFGSFLRTYRASEIILSSKSREQLARRLKNDGPLNLRSLRETDLLQLVDILISEKKYIKEFPTRSSRFQPNPPPGKSITPVQPHNQNEFSSGFSSSIPRNPGKKPSDKTRSEILEDSQKLLDELLGECPEGFNVCVFKKKFLEKYGYVLDHQKLGYPKLVSLLQIMSGIKIESAQVFPDNVTNAPGIESLGSKGRSSGSDSEMSDSPLKRENGESPWEELGPIEEESKVKVKVNHEYEPSVSDDDEFSDVEEDGPTKSEDRTRSRVKEDSSLLQILNSWHSPKGEMDPQKVQGSNPEGKSGQSGSVAVASKCEGSFVDNYGTKPRTGKSYSFVADSLESDKDKLIDGILGSLKKSDEPRMQS